MTAHSAPSLGERPTPKAGAASRAEDNRRRPVIVDTDPGIDDVAALVPLLFDDTVDVKLIATVSGNVDVRRTTANTLGLLEFLGLDIPVVKGSEAPLRRPAVYAPQVHGESGIGGVALPAPDPSRLVNGDVVEAYRDVLERSAEPVDVIAIGPLTNLGALFGAYPQAAERIGRITLMGGSFGPKYSWACDFNIAVDPEAARIVFGAGVPIDMIGVEIGRKTVLDADDLAALAGSGPVGGLIARMLGSYHDDAVTAKPGVQLYDPATVLFYLQPELYVAAEARVDIVPQPYPSLHTITEVRFMDVPVSERTVRVPIDVDVYRFRDAYLERVARVDRILAARR